MPTTRDLIASAAEALKERIEEVNRLNVFPVPDGDTGTNMSLTMDAVMDAVMALEADATIGETCHAVTHGSLMGARGNSGVILSQILRGLCEGVDDVAVDRCGTPRQGPRTLGHRRLSSGEATGRRYDAHRHQGLCC